MSVDKVRKRRRYWQ